MIKSRRLRWAEGGERNAKTFLAGKGAEKRTLGRPRCSWEDNVPMSCKKIG
jgi:hypothetical protein